GGSGDVCCSHVISLAQGMEEKEKEGRIKLFRPTLDFYSSYVSKAYENGVPGLIPEPEIDDSLAKEASLFSDTAIFAISRFSGENWDRTCKNSPSFSTDKESQALLDTQASIFEDGDFYLSHNEKKTLECIEKYFSKIIVILNAGSVVDVSWIKDDGKITAALNAYQGGMEGGRAMADCLLGTVSPSGRLPDTYARSLEDYYSTSTFHESMDYVDYTDDIYVGYRYFDTIPGAGDKVVYPFGFGLSYSSFSVKEKKAELSDSTVSITLEVENTGDHGSKDVLEVFVESPSSLSLDRPKRTLAAFGKTPDLKKGEKCTLCLSFPLSSIASFDDSGIIEKSAWVLEKGKYSILVSDNGRDFISSSLVLDIQDDIVFEKCRSLVSPSRLPYRLKADGTLEKLDTEERESLEPGFERQNPDDLEGVVPEERRRPWPRKLQFSPTEKELSLLRVADGDMSLSEFVSSLPDEVLVDMTCGQPNRGVANTFGFGNQEEYDIPSVMTADGPAGLRLKKECGIYTTAWPCATALAASWDTSLVEEIGEAGGLEVKENGIGLWLTPAVNIHRSPLCGRNFEYYSEDPLLAGKMAAHMVMGIQKNGIGASVKHFALNNKETNRKDSDSRVSERALREIYLKQFEIIVKEARPFSLMSSYNIVNGTRASENKELLTGILREEWGFEGFVTSDWWTHGEHYLECLAGNDLKMGNGYPERVKRALDEGLITRGDIVKNVTHILSSILKMD
ncbi:MAG: glycoside hydrolase family 3 N-terminal domain-containing protein, partial [Candidatus Ornithospirochaeta sp.]